MRVLLPTFPAPLFVGFLMLAVRGPDLPPAEHFTQIASSWQSLNAHPLPPHTRYTRDQGNRILVFGRQLLTRKHLTSNFGNHERKASNVLNLIDFRQAAVELFSQRSDESSIVRMLGILGTLNDAFPIYLGGTRGHPCWARYVGSKCSHDRKVITSRSSPSSNWECS